MSNTNSNSRLIAFLGHFGVVCLLAMPLSILAMRLGLHFRIGLLIFALSALLGLIVCIGLVVAALLPRYRAERSRALMRTLPPLLPVVVFLAILLPSGDVPPIHDITTDTDDPPVFDSGVFYRGEDSNSIEIKPDVIAIQKEHYPDLASISTTMSPAEAFERATAVAQAMEWEIYNSDPDNGLFEAVYTSFWFGFKDDIVVRVRRSAEGSKIDLRSVSRVGQSDLGANAARIRAFADEF